MCREIVVYLNIISKLIIKLPRTMNSLSNNKALTICNSMIHLLLRAYAFATSTKNSTARLTVITFSLTVITSCLIVITSSQTVITNFLTFITSFLIVITFRPFVITFRPFVITFRPFVITSLPIVITCHSTVITFRTIVIRFRTTIIVSSTQSVSYFPTLSGCKLAAPTIRAPCSRHKYN